MKINHLDSRKRGFSLLELIVAVGVLAIMATGIMVSFGYGFTTIKRVRHNQRATQILLEKLETMRLYSWTQVNTSGFIPTTFTDVYDPQGTGNSQGITYNGTVALTGFPRVTTYAANLRQVEVTVRWTDDGVSHERSIKTFVGKDGLQNYVY